MQQEPGVTRCRTAHARRSTRRSRTRSSTRARARSSRARRRSRRLKRARAYATARTELRRLLYGPPNWVVGKFSSEDRRMFGFWTIIIATIGAVFFGRAVLYVTTLSVLALIPNFASETPVEE